MPPKTKSKQSNDSKVQQKAVTDSKMQIKPTTASKLQTKPSSMSKIQIKPSTASKMHLKSSKMQLRQSLSSKIQLRRTTSTAPETSNWRRELREVNVNKVISERDVEFVICNECLPKYFDDIQKFQKYAYIYTTLSIKPVIYEEILYIIKHYPAWDWSYASSHYEEMFREACAEAKIHLKGKKPIPLELMAELIKIRVILLIEEDAYYEKVLVRDAEEENVIIDLTASCKTNSDMSTDEDEKMKDTISTKESKILQHTESQFANDGAPSSFPDDYINPYDTVVDTVDVFFSACSVILQSYIQTQLSQRRKRESIGFRPILTESDKISPAKKKIPTPWHSRHCKWLSNQQMGANTILNDSDAESLVYKHIFVVLTGFYDPNLIIHLQNIGLPVACTLSIGTRDDKPTDPMNPNSSINRIPLWSPSTYVPIYHYSLQKLYTQSTRPITIFDLNYDDMKQHVVYHFWNTLDMLHETHFNELKETIYMVCPPIDIHGRFVEIDSKEYNEQCKKMYDNVGDILSKLHSLKKWYYDYCHDIKYLDLGEAFEYVPVHDMFYYNDLINKFPTDCYSVGLTVEGLVEEVHHRIEQENSDSPEYYLTTDNEKSKKYKKLFKLYNKLLEEYKFIYMPLDPLFYYELFQLNKWKKHKITKPKRFEIHENDILQLKETYNKSIANKLRSKTLKDLKKSPPSLLWDFYKDLESYDKDNEVLYKNQYSTWSSLLRLSPEEVTEKLHIYMFNLINCLSNEETESMECELHKYFPKLEMRDNTIYIDRDYNFKKKSDADSINIYEDFSENNLKWYENLSPSVLLQQLDSCRKSFNCMDHVHVPFMDSIFVKFHDKCDSFGISTTTWKAGLRGTVTLYDFFRSAIFEETRWISKQEKMYDCLEDSELSYKDLTLADSNAVPYDSNLLFASSCGLEEKNKPKVPLDRTLIKSIAAIAEEPFIGYKLDRHGEVSGVSTIFHSLEGLKIKVDRSYFFTYKPTITFDIEADNNRLILHANPAYHFGFHIEASNGARIVFCKPERSVQKGEEAKKILLKKPRKKQQRYYSIREIETIGFSDRISLSKIHFLNEKSLVKILDEITPNESLNSMETLKSLESRKSILFKPTPSVMDLRRRNRFPSTYLPLLKAIKEFKRTAIPHFRIVSTPLHRDKCVKVERLKILIKFANGIKTLKYIPNLNLKKKIEITKCMKVKQDIRSVSRSSIDSNLSYDTRLSLPNGLQIAMEPGLEPDTNHVIQYYISPNPNIPDEISRTYTRNGFIQIRYRDGSIKLMGINGKSIVGEMPYCSGLFKKIYRRPTRPIYNFYPSDEEVLEQYMRLRKNVHRKVSRFQKKFTNYPGKKYLRNKNKKEVHKCNDFEILRNNNLINKSDVHLTGNEKLSSAIEFYIPEDCFEDSYTIDIATADSHSSINDDGELTTIYTDGTRITSWFKIEQEMIVFEEEVDKRSSDTGAFELDTDDYLCNFLIPRTGGWVSVILLYQFEHPNYATIVYGPGETHIRLPDNIEYQARADGTFFTNLNDEMYVYVKKDKIKINTNYCKNCYDYCETILNIKPLYDNDVDIKADEVLLQAKDSFKKVFNVDYDGTCHRNDSYSQGPDKHDCNLHRIDDTQKYFVFDKNFNGKMFWTNRMVENRLNEISKSKTQQYKQYLDEKKELRVYDFTKYFYTHYCDRFLMTYRHPSPPIFKYKNFENNLKSSVYNMKNQLSILTNYEKVLPLFMLIKDLNMKPNYESPPITFENIFHLEKYLNPEISVDKSSSSDTIKMKLPALFADVAVDNFAKLVNKAKNFRVSPTEEIRDFQKKLDDDTDSLQDGDHECSPECFMHSVSRVHPKCLYHNILQHKKKNKLSKLQMKGSAIKKKKEEMPPVPKNSVVSINFVHTSDNICRNRTISISDFIKEDIPFVPCEQSAKYNPLIASTLLETTEWKNTDYVTTPTSSTIVPQSKTARKTYARTKNAATCTSAPFDLFLDKPETRQYVSETKVSKIDSGVKKKTSDEPPLQQSENYPVRPPKKINDSKAECKQSKLISGVHAIGSYNKVYGNMNFYSKEAVKNRDMKRFTELHRNEKMEGATLGSETKQLPLILPSTYETKLPSKQQIAQPKEEVVERKSNLLPKMNLRRDNSIASKTLEHLSVENIRRPSIRQPMKYVPSAIDKKIQSQFHGNKTSQEVYFVTSVTRESAEPAERKTKNKKIENKTKQFMSRAQ